MFQSENGFQLFDRGAPHDCREALFGGRGKVRVWSLLAAPRLPFTAVLACELEPGARVGAHVQEHYPELVIGISGSGRALVNGALLELASGSVVELPLGDTLVLDNPSTDTALRYLIVKSAAST